MPKDIKTLKFVYLFNVFDRLKFCSVQSIVWLIKISLLRQHCKAVMIRQIQTNYIVFKMFFENNKSKIRSSINTFFFHIHVIFKFFKKLTKVRSFTTRWPIYFRQLSAMLFLAFLLKLWNKKAIVEISQKIKMINCG